MDKKIVVALGGNAILNRGEEASFSNQLKNVEKTAGFLADLIEEGYQLVISHGNGPQVGNLVLQNELTQGELPPMPLYALTAQTQGLIGYMLEEALVNELMLREVDREVVTLLTRVEVDGDDPSFKDPSKPIGQFYQEEDLEDLRAKGWIVKKDSNRGYRRVVYSPQPVNVLEAATINQLLDQGKVVIAGGGGGIPVIKEGGRYRGIEAVIDKDFTSSKLAEAIGADIFMILTNVDYAYKNFAREDQEALGRISWQDMMVHVDRGEFAQGSMLPKVLASINFAKTGRPAYISSLEKADLALKGESGTNIVL